MSQLYIYRTNSEVITPNELMFNDPILYHCIMSGPNPVSIAINCKVTGSWNRANHCSFTYRRNYFGMSISLNLMNCYTFEYLRIEDGGINYKILYFILDIKCEEGTVRIPSDDNKIIPINNQVPVDDIQDIKIRLYVPTRNDDYANMLPVPVCPATVIARDYNGIARMFPSSLFGLTTIETSHVIGMPRGLEIILLQGSDCKVGRAQFEKSTFNDYGKNNKGQDFKHLTIAKFKINIKAKVQDLSQGGITTLNIGHLYSDNFTILGRSKMYNDRYVNIHANSPNIRTAKWNCQDCYNNIRPVVQID